jgi:hypothetical protein
MTALPWGEESWKEWGLGNWGKFPAWEIPAPNYKFKFKGHYAASFGLFEDSTDFWGICSENAGCEERPAAPTGSSLLQRPISTQIPRFLTQTAQSTRPERREQS